MNRIVKITVIAYLLFTRGVLIMLVKDSNQDILLTGYNFQEGM